jgi:hypothetical protein
MFTYKDKKQSFYRKGKIKSTILVVAFVILAVYLGIGVVVAYHEVGLSFNTVGPSSENATSTTITTATTTTNITSGSTVVQQTSTSSTSTTAILPPETLQNIGHAVGIAAGGGLGKTSAANINQELDQMVALGVTWVRFDIEWGDVQYSSPNNSTWSAYDTMVKAITAHHMHALAILLFTPQWARDPKCGGGAKCPPTNPAQFATFAAEAATRYRGEVNAWEIWNEPNSYNFWATKTDCNAYTTLLKATYPAIKKVDPNAIVITGGLAPEATDNNNLSQMDFLTCIYKDGGKNYFDAVGDHSYTFPNLPSSNDTNIWAQMSETSPSLRSIMMDNGDANKKIWITEFGAPTNGPDPHWYVSEQGQANMVTDAMQLYKTYDWAGPIFWYTLKDDGTSTSTIENFFGLTHADGSLKPAYSTLKNIISGGL